MTWRIFAACLRRGTNFSASVTLSYPQGGGDTWEAESTYLLVVETLPLRRKAEGPLLSNTHPRSARQLPCLAGQGLRPGSRRYVNRYVCIYPVLGTECGVVCILSYADRLCRDTYLQILYL